MTEPCETKIATTAEHFELFRAACAKYLQLFGITEWKVYYGLDAAPDCFADTILNTQDSVATIRLTAQWNVTYWPLTAETLDQNARHEVIHVLIGSLTGAAYSRWVASEGQVDRVVERTVHQIEHVLDAVAGNALAPRMPWLGPPLTFSQPQGEKENAS